MDSISRGRDRPAAAQRELRPAARDRAVISGYETYQFDVPVPEYAPATRTRALYSGAMQEMRRVREDREAGESSASR